MEHSSEAKVSFAIHLTQDCPSSIASLLRVNLPRDTLKEVTPAAFLDFARV